jgi:hypothetical protein
MPAYIVESDELPVSRRLGSNDLLKNMTLGVPGNGVVVPVLKGTLTLNGYGAPNPQ